MVSNREFMKLFKLSKNIKLTEEQVNKFCEWFSNNDLEFMEKRIIQSSCSSEGGVAIPYDWMGLKNFGEWLHLRFYKKYDWHKNKDYYVMEFVTNANKRYTKWTKEEFQIVFNHAKKMVKFMEEHSPLPLKPKDMSIREAT